jgi:hypothetical protein
MKIIPILTMVSMTGACAVDESSNIDAITAPPPMLTGVSTRLTVPTSCPTYTPNGRDIDTPEPPWQAPLQFGCGVDELGNTYGLVTGDTGDLAILPGDREIGLFLAFDQGSLSPTVDPATAIKAWAGALNVDSTVDPTVELHASMRVPFQVVALGPAGIMLSLGHVADQPLQFNVDWNVDALFPGNTLGYGVNDRFYVNGAPPIPPGE